MKNYKILFSALFAVIMLGSCRSQFESILVSGNVDQKYTIAKEYYDNGKFKKAAAVFESLSMQTSGMEVDDTVRFLWAMSNYRMKDYVSAQANFQSFCELYTQSPFSEQANFLNLECMYNNTLRYELDQTPTHQCLMALSEYLMAYPDGEYSEECRKMGSELQGRLDLKEFEAARLYYKMEDYIAAKTSLKNILKDHPDNIYREDVMYYLTKASFRYALLSVSSKQKDRYMDFVDNYLNFIGEYPESRYVPELENFYARYQKGQGIDHENRQQRKQEKKSEKETSKALKQKDA